MFYLQICMCRQLQLHTHAVSYYTYVTDTCVESWNCAKNWVNDRRVAVVWLPFFALLLWGLLLGLLLRSIQIFFCLQPLWFPCSTCAIQEQTSSNCVAIYSLLCVFLFNIYRGGERGGNREYSEYMNIWGLQTKSVGFSLQNVRVLPLLLLYFKTSLGST